MRKIYVFSILLVFASRILFAQSNEFAIGIGSTYSDYAYDIQVASSNSVYLAGGLGVNGVFGTNLKTPLHQTSSYGYFISKFDNLGNFKWNVLIDSDSINYFFSKISVLKVDSMENLWVAGNFYKSIKIPRKNQTDTTIYEKNGSIYILKLDSSGNLKKLLQLGGKYLSNVRSINDLKLYNSNTFYILVSSADSLSLAKKNGDSTKFYNSGSGVMVLAKIDSTGNYNWAQKITATYPSGSINIDKDNNIYININSSNAVFQPDSGVSYTFNKTFPQTYFAKYNVNGKLIWAKYPFVSNFYTSSFFSFSSNNFFFTGGYYGPISFNTSHKDEFDFNASSNVQIFYGKMDTSGNTIWVKSLNSTGQGTPGKIEQDKLGDIILTGEFDGDLTLNNSATRKSSVLHSTTGYDEFITKLSSTGDYIWSKTINTHSLGFKYTLDSNNDILGFGSFYNDKAFVHFVYHPTDTIVKLLSQNDPSAIQFDLIFWKIKNKYNNPPYFALVSKDSLLEDFGVDTIKIIPDKPLADEINEKIIYTIKSDTNILRFTIDSVKHLIILNSKKDKNGVDKIIITANDGESENFLYSDSLKINILPVNDPPIITGIVDTVKIKQEKTATILLSNLKVTDIDNLPVDYSLIIKNGSNYKFNGYVITPSSDFTGILSVKIAVSDGMDTSVVFNYPIIIEKVTEVKEAENFQLTILYPNPFENVLNIAVTEGIQYTVKISDINGKPLLVKSSDQVNNNMLDVTSLHKGIYFLQIILKSETKTYKIVKE
jgi:hypothetical protein